MKKSKYIEFEDGSAVLKKDKKIGIKELIISIILAVLLFFCLLMIESKILSSYDKSTVMVAINSIPKSTQITETNVDSYFKEEKIPTNIMPQGTVIDKNDLINKVLSDSINQGEIIVDSRFSDEQKYLAKINNPLEVGISVAGSSQIVGGIIRKGDLINIYIVDSGTKTCSMILKNVYVSKAFDTNAMEIVDAGSNEQSLSINIFLDASNEQAFNEAVANGTVYISKVLSESTDQESDSKNITLPNVFNLNGTKDKEK